MIYSAPSPTFLPLSITALKQDGTAKTDVVSGSVRVYHFASDGTLTVDRSVVALANDSGSIWKYTWAPGTLVAGPYVVEYTLIDASLTYVTTEDLVVYDAQAAAAAALSAYGAATATNVTGVPAATDVVLSLAHGSGGWGASGGITAQEVRDALKLAPTSGSPATGSIDKHLDDLPTDTDTRLTSSHGAGDWGGGGGTGLTAQQTRDAMKLAPSSGSPAGGSIDSHLDDIMGRANAGGVFGTALADGSSKIYVGDVKVPIYFDCVLDISTGTKFEIQIVKPDGVTTATWTGTLYGTHEIKYETTGTDIAAAGVYACTPYFELASGMKAHRPTVYLTIYAVGT
jgi:hypothetical protein